MGLLLVGGRGLPVLGSAACACLCVVLFFRSFDLLLMCAFSLCVSVSVCLPLSLVSCLCVSGAEPAACERPVVVCVGERVSASNASPCVHSKRPRVYRHQAHMFHTCGLGAGTHADVLNVHTVFFFTFFTVPQHTTTPQQHQTHTTTNNNTTRQDKKREDETRQEGKKREERI